MEFGPRALGHRSILADPRSADMQRALNLKIKYRESFRPFAPAVAQRRWPSSSISTATAPTCCSWRRSARSIGVSPAEEEERLEGLDKLRAVRSVLPAITHVDDSARIQTVHPETSSRFHELISESSRRSPDAACS